MTTELNYHKLRAISWQVDLKLPGWFPSRSNHYHLSNLRAATDYANGALHVITLTMSNLNSLKWYPHFVPGKHYALSDQGPEIISILCEQGDLLPIEPDTQISIGDYTDYIMAGYKWHMPGKRHVKPIYQDVQFRGWWITGGNFFMTNDDKRDSADMSPVNPSAIVEFVEATYD
jgi:hypothetical protein